MWVQRLRVFTGQKKLWVALWDCLSHTLWWVSSAFIETLKHRNRAKGNQCVSWIWMQALAVGRLCMHLIWKVKVTHQSLQLYLSTMKIITHRINFEPKMQPHQHQVYVYPEWKKKLIISLFELFDFLKNLF